MRKILVTGALGRVGTELVPALRARYGADQVVASDIRMAPTTSATEGPFEELDCTRVERVQEVVRRHDVGAVYHFAALLSAAAEARPDVAWSVNVGGLQAVLEVARRDRCAVFLPSSIGAFGPTTPGVGTPQDTTQRPTTLYGITKVTAELLCDYHARRFGLDTRGLRPPCLVFPGVARSRRRHRLRGRDIPSGAAPPALYVPARTRHATRHDVYARRRRRHHRAHGGRGGASDPPQRLQRDGDELHAGRAWPRK